RKMSAYRYRGETEPSRYLGRAEPVAKQLEHFGLPACQLDFETPSNADAPPALSHPELVDHRPQQASGYRRFTSPDCPQRADEAVGVSVKGQVTGGPRIERIDDTLFVGLRREHDRVRCWSTGRDPRGGKHCAARQIRIDQTELRLLPQYRRDRALRVGGLRADLEAVPLEHEANPRARRQVGAGH